MWLRNENCFISDCTELFAHNICGGNIKQISDVCLYGDGSLLWWSVHLLIAGLLTLQKQSADSLPSATPSWSDLNQQKLCFGQRSHNQRLRRSSGAPYISLTAPLDQNESLCEEDNKKNQFPSLYSLSFVKRLLKWDIDPFTISLSGT